MNNGKIWDIVHAVVKKESRGNIIKPDRFTDILQQCNAEYYNQQYEKWGLSQTSTDSMRPFVVLDETVALTTGSATISTGLASTYKHAIAARNAANEAKIDILTPNNWNEWIGDALMTGTATYPIMTMDSTTIKVFPTTITSIKFSYLKASTDPFFDYYIDANYKVQYLTEGQTAYTLQTNEVYRTGATSGSFTSTSVDLEWDYIDIVNIISMILEKLGVGMSAPDITQYAMALEQKQNVA